MKIKKVQSACLILACIAATGLIGCGKTDETPKKHEAITFMAPYLEVDNFIEEVHKTYPEIELEVVPYSGANTTTCLQNMLEADDLPDICTQTFYKPDVVDVSDKMIDLSGYDFTDNYVESRLKDVGYEVTTPIVVTNSDEFNDVEMKAEGQVTVGVELLELS